MQSHASELASFCSRNQCHVMLSLCLFGAMVIAGCGSTSEGDDSGGGSHGVDAAVMPVALTISPPSALIEMIDGRGGTQVFAAVMEMSDGSTVDVTEQTSFTADDALLGAFEGPVFRASGNAGGRNYISASYDAFFARALVDIRIAKSVITASAPADAPARFTGAEERPELAPTLIYPSDQTVFPPNVGDFDVHWIDSTGNELFEVAITGDYVDIRSYVVGDPSGQSWITLAPELWSLASTSHRGSSITITVRGWSDSHPKQVGVSAQVTVPITRDTIEGGIYYWASESQSGRIGIYRHDMGVTGQPAEPFYTTTETPDARCVGCHVLSRDGTRMAITYDRPDGPSEIIDVATRMPLVALDSDLRWNFGTFSPDGELLLTSQNGTLILRNVQEGGSEVTTVPTSGFATHPDFHPEGTAIVYVLTPNPTSDWDFENGSIVVQSFNPVTQTFGEPVTLVEEAGNNYYPSWSPDGHWIVFNHSSEDAYDDASAEVYVVNADGTMPPRRLSAPNLAEGLTNSWVRWAPFEQTFGTGTNAETFYWLTFSSKRDFGVRLVGANQPQIWMAPFFPARARQGEQPSTPAFRLPTQNLDGSNHIAQWTERVIPIE